MKDTLEYNENDLEQLVVHAVERARVRGSSQAVEVAAVMTGIVTNLQTRLQHHMDREAIMLAPEEDFLALLTDDRRYDEN